MNFAAVAIALLGSFFTVSNAQAQQDAWGYGANEPISTVQILTAPQDSVFHISFQTTDLVEWEVVAKSVYYRPYDFIVISNSVELGEIMTQPLLYLKGHPTIHLMLQE